jgi:hypothetical protein
MGGEKTRSACDAALAEAGEPSFLLVEEGGLRRTGRLKPDVALSGDRGFESISLQRGVRCELAEPAAVYGFKAATRHKRHQNPDHTGVRRFPATNAPARADAAR